MTRNPESIKEKIDIFSYVKNQTKLCMAKSIINKVKNKYISEDKLEEKLPPIA